MASTSVPSDAGESAYDVDELADVMSSVPARSSIDSSVTPGAAVRYDRYYDVKTDSFDSYDRDSVAYDAPATALKDSGYQTFGHQQAMEPEPPYLNHVDVNGWQQPPAAVNGDMRRSPITVIDSQASRQSFFVSHPATDGSLATDQRWPGSTPPVSDGLPLVPPSAPAGYDDAVTSSADYTSFGYDADDVSLLKASWGKHAGQTPHPDERLPAEKPRVIPG